MRSMLGKGPHTHGCESTWVEWSVENNWEGGIQHHAW